MPTSPGRPSEEDSASQFVVPDTDRRRRAGVVYLVGGALAGGGISAELLPSAMWWTVVSVLVAIGVYHLLAGWRLELREPEALAMSAREVDFAVGPASASLGFSGWRARPTWNLLVFSADRPPSRQGLVRIDAVDGAIIDAFSEDASDFH